MKKLYTSILAIILTSCIPLAHSSGVSSPSGYNASNVTITGGTIIGLANEAGLIFEFGGSTCPAGALLVGTVAANASRSTYPALFTAIGVTWGAGDGSTTFGLPWIPADYVPIQASANVGTSSVGQVIAHTHTTPTANTGNSANGAGTYGGINGVTGSTGGSANLAAGVRVLHCIKY